MLTNEIRRDDFSVIKILQIGLILNSNKMLLFKIKLIIIVDLGKRHEKMNVRIYTFFQRFTDD